MRFAGSDIKSLPDRELMGQIATGDERAFGILYERYKNRLFYFFLRMLGNCEETANDFLQDLFIKIIDKPHLYHPGYPFSTWIFSVANNMCKNEYRKRKIRDFESIENIVNTVVFEDTLKIKIKSEEKINVLFKEIENLSEDLRTILILKYKENFCLKEISDIMGIPEGTVKSRLFYARKELSDRLSLLNG